jgi:hypothetical protein
MTKINSIKFVLLIALILGSVSCDNSRVKGTITFEGTKINKLTSVQPEFWFRNEDKNTTANPNVGLSIPCEIGKKDPYDLSEMFI